MPTDPGQPSAPAEPNNPAGPAGQEPPLLVLRRWEDSGAVWRVTLRTATSVDIDLLTCAADEVMGRLHTSDPAVLAYVEGRESSD